MKRIYYSLAFLVLIIGMSLSSCVSKKKFVDSEAKAEMHKKNNLATTHQLTECNEQLRNQRNENASLKTENAMTQSDLKDLTSKSQMTIAEQAKLLKNLQKVIQYQNDLMNNLKESISEALMNYRADELFVYLKDGNLYISMEEKLLFKSGSDVVDPKGKEALKTLALVLNSTKDINVVIEGHTDSIPIKTAQFKDNWDLSSARAISIVRILVNENGFDSNRISSSGKSKYHPIKSNETAEGRASNRRTEIILSPDLRELQKLLYQ